MKCNGVFCVNYQTQDTPGLGKTVQHNAYEDEEIGDPGLTAEECVRINAAKIRECGLHLECRVIWERAIPQSDRVVIASRVEYVTMEKSLLDTELRKTAGI